MQSSGPESENNEAKPSKVAHDSPSDEADPESNDDDYVPLYENRSRQVNTEAVDLTGVAESWDSSGIGARTASHILTPFSVAVQGKSGDNVIVKTLIRTALEEPENRRTKV